MWEISNTFQWISFGRAILCGLFICLLYDIFKIYRTIFKSGILATAISDIVFWLITTFFVFCFFIASTNGQVRVFLLFGMLIGFVICRFTVSKLIFVIIKPIKKIISIIKNLYEKFIRKISNISIKRIFKLKNVKKNIG